MVGMMPEECGRARGVWCGRRRIGSQDSYVQLFLLIPGKWEFATDLL